MQCSDQHCCTADSSDGLSWIHFIRSCCQRSGSALFRTGSRSAFGLPRKRQLLASRWKPTGSYSYLRWRHHFLHQRSSNPIQPAVMPTLARTCELCIRQLLEWPHSDQDWIPHPVGSGWSVRCLPRYPAGSHLLHKGCVGSRCGWIPVRSATSRLGAGLVLPVSCLNTHHLHMAVTNPRLQRSGHHQSLPSGRTAQHLHHPPWIACIGWTVHPLDQRLLPVQGTFGGQGWFPAWCPPDGHFLVHECCAAMADVQRKQLEHARTGCALLRRSHRSRFGLLYRNFRNLNLNLIRLNMF